MNGAFTGGFPREVNKLTHMLQKPKCLTPSSLNPAHPLALYSSGAWGELSEPNTLKPAFLTDVSGLGVSLKGWRAQGSEGFFCPVLELRSHKKPSPKSIATSL